jgi:hypothetical protein
MKREKEIQKLFEKFLSGEISQTESDQLQNYAKDYPEYKELIHLHQKLADLEFPLTDPDISVFNQMRADVLRKIRLKNQRQPGIIERYIDKVKNYTMRPEMAVAALTLIIGFLLGRALPPDEGALSSNLINQISALATKHTKLEDIRKSPVVYSNVEYKDLNDDRVAIKLDATTHLDFVRKKDDPLVLEVMAQTLLSSSNIGSELKAISYTEGIADPKVKETLIFTMQHTSALATRMRAMSNLSNFKNDRDVREAFLKVLREEESVKMRLLAVDYLTRDQVPPDVLQQAINESEVNQSPAVMIKMRKYIDEQRAE